MGFDYAVGDLQGSYDALRRLLDNIDFDFNCDRLWLVGDLINRGTQSLEVLRFLKNLPVAPIITLGNHDLYFLAIFYKAFNITNKTHTLDKLLKAPDCADLASWLRKQNLIHYDKNLNIVMTHAGIPPIWTLQDAIGYAQEVENTIIDNDLYLDFFMHIYGDLPDCWDNDLTGHARLRLICNYLTRMRTCDEKGKLNIKFDGNLDNIPRGFYPWFCAPNRKPIEADIVFGHWAAINGITNTPNIYAIDTGYIWGNKLTALRLQDKKTFHIQA